MDQNELNAALDASPSPDRITPEYLKSRIASVDYVSPQDFGILFQDNPATRPTMTLCVVTLDNGFQVTGESACADPANYNEGIGRKIAYDVAERKIWPLLGFMLKEALHRRDQRALTLRGDGWGTYRSHKIVDAAVIRAAEFEHDGSGKVAIRDTNGGPEIVEVPAGFSRKSGSIHEGDILVRYSDGYLSWSPRKAFAEGYTDA